MVRLDVRKLNKLGDKYGEKRNLSDFRYLLYTFVLMLIVMFVLPFYSVDTYSIVKKPQAIWGHKIQLTLGL